jgi:hypothetical protein
LGNIGNNRDNILGQATFTTGSGPVLVVAGEFNRDTNLDLAVASSCEYMSIILIIC